MAERDWQHSTTETNLCLNASGLKLLDGQNLKSRNKKNASLSNFSSVGNLISESEADWLKAGCIKSITVPTREPKIKDVMLPDGLKVGNALPKLAQ